MALGLATGGVVILAVGLIIAIAMLYQRYNPENKPGKKSRRKEKNILPTKASSVETVLDSELHLSEVVSTNASSNDTSPAQHPTQGNSRNFQKGRNTFFTSSDQHKKLSGHQPKQHIDDAEIRQDSPSPRD